MDRTQTVDECLWVIDEDDLRKRTVDAVWPVSPWKFRVNSFLARNPWSSFLMTILSGFIKNLILLTPFFVFKILSSMSS